MKTILDYNVVLVHSGPEPTLRQLVYAYYDRIHRDNHLVYSQQQALDDAKFYCDVIEEQLKGKDNNDDYFLYW